MLVYVVASENSTAKQFGDACSALIAQGHTLAQPSSASVDVSALVRCDYAVLVGEPESATITEVCGEVVIEMIAACEDCHVPLAFYGTTMPDLPIHPVAERCPQQCLGFLAAIMQQYRVHLDKNKDYGTGNILITGELGILTRIMDKMLRYANLMGLRLNFSGPGSWHAVSQPQNEAIEDTLLDLSNYGIIARLVRKGIWGK